MAGKRSRNVWPQGISRGNTPPGDLGDVCAIFTRDEIAGWFCTSEASGGPGDRPTKSGQPHCCYGASRNRPVRSLANGTAKPASFKCCI